jgi:EAL domain-containing protein (putative c-di-GMP-specific phosphodiesterase class I)/GGDEF domain-containing protein
METKSKVLLLIDDATLREPLSREVAALGCDLSFPSQDVMQKVFDEVPHLILIDEDFGRGRGRLIARDIKEDLVLRHIPIVMLVKSHGMMVRDKYSKIDLYFEKGQDTAGLLSYIRSTLRENINELDVNPLTHLPGSRSSVLCIENALHTHKPCSICCVDMSNFSVYNHVYGDARGDRVIARLGEIASQAVKEEGANEDFIGHLGGDDFVVVTEPGRAVRVSEAIIRQFDEAIPQFYDEGDRKRGYVLSKGNGSLYERYPMMNVTVVIVQAENLKLSQIGQLGEIASKLKRSAKSLPGSCYIKYQSRPLEGSGTESSLEVRFPDRMQSVTVKTAQEGLDKHSVFFDTLRSGKRIQTVYQPIVNLKTRRIFGYEALARPTEGDFIDNPEALFSVARETGRVKELDRYCVECALKNSQALGGDKKLFLNLNHETLIDPDAMKDLFAEKGSIGYDNIVIEVTEQSILRSFDRLREALTELKEKGVSVAIDDVGGGAVSLRDVAVLRPDFIKFDKSLIREIDKNITKQQIIISMIIFANGIHAVTTAEGIETKREYEAALMCGVTLGQGYYFARPGKTLLEFLI